MGSSGIELGKVSEYKDVYDASLLVPIARSQARAALPDCGKAATMGRDYWTAFELSWLNSNGVPQVAIAEFSFDPASANIIESKSFKYYLNSFNQTTFQSQGEVEKTLRGDLSQASGADVEVRLITVESDMGIDSSPPGQCVDQLNCLVEHYQPSSDILEFSDELVEQRQLYSHLLKSNCPVTGQPDWATLWIQYSGRRLSEESFLKYVVAFRQYQGFHESCVERIFSDLLAKGEPDKLCVYARYTRRGGLDINPIRYSRGFNLGELPFGRLARQ